MPGTGGAVATGGNTASGGATGAGGDRNRWDHRRRWKHSQRRSERSGWVRGWRWGDQGRRWWWRRGWRERDRWHEYGRSHRNRRSEGHGRNHRNRGSPGTGGTTTSPCSVTPVSPGSSPQAQKLLCYLYSQYGNHVLSGQQESNWNASPTDISWYNTNIGKYPAIDGSDFLYTNGASCSSVTVSTTRAIAYWNAGGLTMFRYHVGEPVAGSTCTQDCYMGANCAEPTTAASSSLLTNAITAGTAENTAWNNRLDYLAVQIGAMKTANVPIILALFHETQSNGWFWWAQGTAAQFVALYKYTFNYLTATKGLNNIIWLMPYSGTPAASFYPGASVVDIAGGTPTEPISHLPLFTAASKASRAARCPSRCTRPGSSPLPVRCSPPRRRGYSSISGRDTRRRTIPWRISRAFILTHTSSRATWFRI